MMKWKHLFIKDGQLQTPFALIICLLLPTLFFHLTGIGCPIRFVTGIPCPGCGLTRAALALLHFNPSLAFYYHPMIFALPLFGLILLLRSRLPQRLYKTLIFTLLILYVILYVVRLCDSHNTVIAVHLNQGLIYRIIHKIFGICNL